MQRAMQCRSCIGSIAMYSDAAAIAGGTAQADIPVRRCIQFLIAHGSSSPVSHPDRSQGFGPPTFFFGWGPCRDRRDRRASLLAASGPGGGPPNSALSVPMVSGTRRAIQREPGHVGHLRSPLMASLTERLTNSHRIPSSPLARMSFSRAPGGFEPGSPGPETCHFDGSL